MCYTGRDMRLAHKGMKINEKDWSIFIHHVKETLDKFSVPEWIPSEVLSFVDTTRSDIVEN